MVVRLTPLTPVSEAHDTTPISQGTLNLAGITYDPEPSVI